MGDLIARIGNTELDGVMQRFNKAAINEHAEALIEFCA